MALTNSATIQLTVNVQNMAGLRSLTLGLQALRTQIMAVQRNPAMRSATGSQTPAQAMRAQFAVQRAAQAQQLVIQRQADRAQAAAIKGQAAIASAAQRGAAQQVKAGAAVVRAQASTRTAMAQSIRSALGLNTAEQKLATQMQKKNVQTKGQAKELGSLATKLERAELRVDALWRAAFRLQMLGADFTRMGQALIGAVTGPAQEFGDFEFMALRAAGALQLFNTNTDNGKVSTRDLENAIIDTAKEMRLFPAKDIAEAVYFWGSTTGQTVESQEDLQNVMGSLTPIVKGAAMTQTDLETAIKGVYGIMSQFYPVVIETDRATGNFDKTAALTKQTMEGLFYVAQTTAVEFDDLVESFKMVGPVAAGVGASFEDMVELFGRLGNLGIRGSSAGRAFRQLFIQMARPPLITQMALKQLFTTFEDGSVQFQEQYDYFKGKSFLEAMWPHGEFVGTQKFLEGMYIATKNLNTQERIAILARFSTANLLPTMIALVAAEGRAYEKGGRQIMTSAEQHAEWARVFKDSWTLLSESFKGVQGAFERSIEALRLQVGRAFAEALKPFMDVARNVIDAITDWVEKNPELVQQIGQIATIAGIALTAIGALFTIMGTAVGIAAGLSLAFEAFGGIILRWSGFGAVIASVIAAIIENFDTVRERLEEAQQAIQRAIQNVTGYFEDGDKPAIDFMETFRELGRVIVEHVTNAIVFIAHFIEEVSKFKPLFDFIKNVAIPIASQFIMLWAGRNILSAISRVTGLTRGLGGMLTMLQNISKYRRVSDMDKAILQGLPSTAMLDKSKSGLRGVGNAVKGLGTGLKNFATAHFDLALMAVVAIGFAAYENNWLGFRSIVDGLTDSFRNLDAELNAAFEDINIKNSVIQSMTEVGQAGGFVLRDELTGAVGQAVAQIPGLVAVMDWPVVGEIIGSNLNLVESIGIEQVKEGFTDLWSKATYGAKDAQQATANINKELLAMGLGVQDFWRAWQLGTEQLNLDPTQATQFGQAMSESMRNGSATARELKANIIELGGSASWVDNLTDAGRRFLGVMTETEERASAMQQSMGIVAQELATELTNIVIPREGLDEAQSKNVATLIDNAGNMMDKVSPEMQEILTTAIAHVTEQALIDGTDGGAASFLNQGSRDNALYSALSELGKTHIDQGVWDQLQDSITDSLSKNATIEDAVAEAIGKVDGAKLIEDTLYPVIGDMADAAAQGFQTIFTPSKFKDSLKDVVGDEKGWRTFFQNINDKTAKAALAGEKGEWAQSLAQDYYQGLFTGFKDAWPAVAPEMQTKISGQILEIFNQDTIKDMTPAMQQFAVDTLATMYEGMDQPIPDWLNQMFVDMGGTWSDLVQRGATANEVTIPVTAPTDSEIGAVLGTAFNKDFDLTAYTDSMRVTLPAPIATWASRAGEDIGVGKGAALASENVYVKYVTDAQTAIDGLRPELPDLVAPDTTAAATAISTFTQNVSADFLATNMHLPSIVVPDTQPPQTEIGNMTTNITNTITALAGPALEWGQHLVSQYAGGISDKKSAATDAAWEVANAVRAILHFSRPDRGPLRDLETWAHHMIEQYARAMRSRSPKVRAAAENIAATVRDALNRANRHAARVADNIADNLKRAGKTVRDNWDKAGRGIQDTLDRMHKHNKAIRDDVERTTKVLVDHIKSPETFKSYDAYLAYLGRVHSKIKDLNHKVKKDRQDTVRDLTVSKTDTDSKVVYENKHKKVIEIRLIAVSPDHTVDRVELKAMRQGVMDALAVADLGDDLSHMVTVG
jgi:TP901 family phage tail tape measure protein